MSETEVVLKVNEKDIPINEFVKTIIANINTSLVTSLSLKNVEDVNKISIEIIK